MMNCPEQNSETFLPVSLRYETRLQWCWLCGRDERERPRGWHAPVFMLEEAHIIGGSTRSRQNIRAGLVILCTMCHHVQHNGPVPRLGWDEEVTKANLVWLKRERDPEYYDAGQLMRWAGRLIEPEAPAQLYLDQYESRRGKPDYLK